MQNEIVNPSPTFIDELPEEQQSILKDMLRSGCRIRGFRSGGGLRVIRIEDADGKDKGYGEHPDVLVAIEHALEAFASGGRTYKEQYMNDDSLYTHYLTGTSTVSCPLDGWLLRGHSFSAKLAEHNYVKVSFTYCSLDF